MITTRNAALRATTIKGTWGGFLLETLIAAAFLSPWPAFLAVFVLVTVYAETPIISVVLGALRTGGA
jgi:hypothetical protein